VPVFGDAGAAAGLPAAALRDSPFPPPAAAPAWQPVWWRWWLGDRLAAIEMAPALLARPEDGARWDALEAALGLLARHRPRRPLDGYGLALSAETLAAHPAWAGEQAARLAAVAGEAAATLGWQAPVHVIVTGLQRLPGHDGFFAALPARAGGQPLGARFDPAELALPEDRVGSWLASLTRRFRRLRLGLLLAGAAEVHRDEAFRFVEALPALAPGLAAAAAALASGRPGAILRSIYLTAPNAAAHHLEDVAERFMAADAGLAGPV
jgi:type VI secretion system protein ImpL